jgi:hypothetical protein
MVVHTCNSCSRKVEAGGLQVWRQPGLYSETLSQKQKDKTKQQHKNPTKPPPSTNQTKNSRPPGPRNRKNMWGKVECKSQDSWILILTLPLSSVFSWASVLTSGPQFLMYKKGETRRSCWASNNFQGLTLLPHLYNLRIEGSAAGSRWPCPHSLLGTWITHSQGQYPKASSPCQGLPLK